MAQRYVFVLADSSGAVIEDPALVSKKVAQMKGKKSRPNKSTSKATQAPTIDSGEAAELGIQLAGAASQIASAKLGDASVASSSIASQEGGADWLDVASAAAPVAGAIVGSLVPGIGTAVGTGVGTAIGAGLQLFDD